MGTNMIQHEAEGQQQLENRSATPARLRRQALGPAERHDRANLFVQVRPFVHLLPNLDKHAFRWCSRRTSRA